MAPLVGPGPKRARTQERAPEAEPGETRRRVKEKRPPEVFVADKDEGTFKTPTYH